MSAKAKLTTMKENELVPVEDKIKEIAEKATPVKIMEGSLAKFVSDVFDMAREEDEYQQAIKEAIIAKLPDMKPSELIALATSASTNKNDLISKVINPSMQLLTAAQANELSLRQQEKQPQYNQTNIREINTTTPTDVLQGLQTLFNLASSVKIEDQNPQEDTSKT